MDMVQLLFSRLPQFKEDPKWSANMKKVGLCSKPPLSLIFFPDKVTFFLNGLV